MTTLTIQINNRPLTAFAPFPDEQVYHPKKNYLFDLSYLASLHVGGEGARDFLQGQLSCDLREVHAHQMRQGALCDLKGRILALLDVVNWEDRGFELILPKDLLPATQAALAKTALFSRATLKASTDITCFGFYLQNPDDLHLFNLQLSNTTHCVVYEPHYCCYCLGNNFYIILVHTTEAQDLLEPFIKNGQWRGSLAWHALKLQQKWVDIYPESRGLFLPHRLNLQLSGHLSFNKGCYKGQEIIARMHYRAKLKHELKLFKIKTDEPLRSGQKILAKNNHEELGELIDYCPIGKGEFIIAASLVFESPAQAHIENKPVTLMPVS